MQVIRLNGKTKLVLDDSEHDGEYSLTIISPDGDETSAEISWYAMVELRNAAHAVLQVRKEEDEAAIREREIERERGPHQPDGNT